ncbi:MAG: ATP phosphoribosyltransferase regulatory subunit [Burkholderiaceae bacterium]
MTRWLLPEGIADLLPGEARALESLRRRLLDRCRSYGFELVEPPLIEYLDSLLIGSGSDLDLKTFKLVDQLTGRLLGVRADMTPQIARIDAHLLHGRGVTRLCYCGPVLHTRSRGAGISREPIQLGAEIYGHAGIEADIESLDLLLGCLAESGIGRGRIDLCDLGLVRLLLADLPGIDEEECFALLEARDLPGLRERLAAHDGGSASAAAELAQLSRCHGAATTVAQRARALLGHRRDAVAIIDRLEQVAASPRLARHHDGFEIALDLADVRGFRYHTGLSFAAYVDGHAQAIGRGGRYDGVGLAFGRSRAATGFSLDLRELAGLCEHPAQAAPIVAPWSDEPELIAAIEALRRLGEAVEQRFPGQLLHAEASGAEREPCRALVKVAGRWQVQDSE